TFAGGKRVASGARALSEGGYQSVPKVTLAGRALIGRAAGVMNLPRIKGSHNAILCGMQAAARVADALKAGRANDERVAYDAAWQKSTEHDVYGGPSACYCPAEVYEWMEEGGAAPFIINAQNCVHCKTCDIKDPNQNTTWVPPEGGGRPNYPNM